MRSTCVGLPCRGNQRVNVLVGEDGQLVFRYEDGSLYDIEVDLAEEALGFGTTTCVGFFERYNSSPDGPGLADIIAPLVGVTAAGVLEFAAQWVLSAPVFDELDPGFADEQKIARRLVSRRLEDLRREISGKKHDAELLWDCINTQHRFKGGGLPFWLWGSIGAMGEANSVYITGEQFRDYPDRFYDAVHNLDALLIMLDQDRYSEEFAREMRGRRMFQMAEILTEGES